MVAEEIVVSFRLSRYNEAVLNLCRTRLNNTLSAAPGSGLPGALGALIQGEENYYALVIQSAYGSSLTSGKAQFSDMVPGFVLPQAFMTGDTSRKLGIPVAMPTVQFRAIAKFTNSSGVGYDGRYQLWHSDFTGLSFPTPA